MSLMKKIEFLSDDAVLIDGRLFLLNVYPKVCPKCKAEPFWDRKEGFYSRPGCLKCNIWFDRVYPK